MAGDAWAIGGQYMESCNCDYLCPCIITNPQGPATHENCYDLMVYRVDAGRCGDAILDGLSFALVIRTGRIMADGDWIFGCVVDERADEVQRGVLAAIASGEAGGPTSIIRENLVADFRGVEFKPIEVTIDGLRRVTAVSGVFAFDVEGVPSRLGNGEPYFLDNTSHPAGQRLALATANGMRVEEFGLNLDLKGVGNNGHFAPFSWQGILP
ncbi:MAG: DUF1326 domain-containing protein [Alphaproteobacteria bacterium]|nr:DUF1326 domain-containing protein [Alphaproteobacteria bacterium]